MYEGGIYAMALATGLYGGLHALAWQMYFRSRVEQALWQASSLAIALTAPSYTLRAVLEELTWKLIGHVYWVFNRANSSSTGASGVRTSTSTTSRLKPLLALIIVFTVSYLPKAVFFVMLPGYVLCRVFLVVESFIQLAHVPKSVLDVVQWAQYVPHVA